jgi:hypothetical protein
MALTGKDIAFFHLIVLQSVVYVHFHLSLCNERAAGATHATLTGVRKIGPVSQCGIENGLSGERYFHFESGTIERDAHFASWSVIGFGISGTGGRRGLVLIGGSEQLDMDL